MKAIPKADYANKQARYFTYPYQEGTQTNNGKSAVEAKQAGFVDLLSDKGGAEFDSFRAVLRGHVDRDGHCRVGRIRTARFRTETATVVLIF